MSNWIESKNRKRCPVCKVFRSYEGPICPPCTKHFAVDKTGKIKRKDLIKDEA